MSAVTPDTQATFDYLFDLAKKALTEGRSFAPFATAATRDGGRTHSQTDMKADNSTPQEHIAALLQVLSQDAKAGKIKSAGVVFDSVAPTEDGKRQSDAVCVHAETAGGEAVQIFVPYTRSHSVIPQFEQPFSQPVSARIFRR